MINLIEIGFSKNKSSSKNNQNIMVYNKGNIIISRPQSSKNPYTILSIKNFKINGDLKLKKKTNKSYTKYKCNKPNKKNNIKKEYKTIKKSVEEMHRRIKKEINDMNDDEEKKNVGYILRNTFTKEELENIIDFGPSPKINRIKLSNNYKKEKQISSKAKPYMPVLETKEQNIINERYLQRTINIFKDNEILIGKINETIQNSKFLNEEKLKKEKEMKKLKIDKEIKQLKQFIENKRKEIKNKIQNREININNSDFKTEEFKGDYLKYSISNINEDEKEKKREKEDENRIEKKDNKKIINKKINKSKIINKNSFVKIIDISKDQKYIDARERLKRTKENCEKAQELALEIEQKIKQDKNIIKNFEYIPTKKQKDEFEIKAQKIIEEVKSNIDINNFPLCKLNKEDQKLIKGAKRYDPYKKGKNKNKKYIPIDKSNEPILLNSINSVKELKEINKDFNNLFKKNNYMEDKEKNISQKWKNDIACSKAYINNFNKAKKVDLNKIKKERNIDLENKNDICNYIYMPKEYDEHWYNNKDTRDITEYRHPFLIYDD